MNIETLFLAWQHRASEQRRLWFPIGRLDVNIKASYYRFRYIGGARKAQQAVGFRPMLDFPDMARDYRSRELFPIFQNRIIARGRPDRTEYLHSLDLPNHADPVAILSVNGGKRVTDAFEVFPKLVKGPNGQFCCRFFLHGSRHVSQAARQRLLQLQDGEALHIALELTSPLGEPAVQVQTNDYHMIGWAPRYLVSDLATALAESPNYVCRVVRLNLPPVPLAQRVLLEMRGRWLQHEPMNGEDFQPLVH